MRSIFGLLFLFSYQNHLMLAGGQQGAGEVVWVGNLSGVHGSKGFGGL